MKITTQNISRSSTLGLPKGTKRANQCLTLNFSRNGLKKILNKIFQKPFLQSMTTTTQRSDNNISINYCTIISYWLILLSTRVIASLFTFSEEQRPFQQPSPYHVPTLIFFQVTTSAITCPWDILRSNLLLLITFTFLFHFSSSISWEFISLMTK